MAVLQKSLYIHGFDRDRTEAGEELDRVQKSLIHNSYTIDLIGFSWNSNTGADCELAKKNAQDNGPTLAKFINELRKIFVQIFKSDL